MLLHLKFVLFSFRNEIQFLLILEFLLDIEHILTCSRYFLCILRNYVYVII